MVNFVTGFRERYLRVPDDLYGKFSNSAESSSSSTANTAGIVKPPSSAQSAAPTPLQAPAQGTSSDSNLSVRPKIKIALKRVDAVSLSSQSSANQPQPAAFVPSRVKENLTSVRSLTKVNPTNVNSVTENVVENVSSFLNGIRATFRQDNVNVTSTAQSKRNVQTCSACT